LSLDGPVPAPSRRSSRSIDRARFGMVRRFSAQVDDERSIYGLSPSVRNRRLRAPRVKSSAQPIRNSLVHVGMRSELPARGYRARAPHSLRHRRRNRIYRGVWPFAAATTPESRPRDDRCCHGQERVRTEHHSLGSSRRTSADQISIRRGRAHGDVPTASARDPPLRRCGGQRMWTRAPPRIAPPHDAVIHHAGRCEA
jgi:hypothetical protein